MARPLDDIARSYADGVKNLFEALPGQPRGVRATLAADVLVKDATLDAESAEFQVTAEAELQSPNKPDREHAAAKLLAKAVVDLDVAGRLLEAADGRIDADHATVTAAASRSVVNDIPPEDLAALVAPLSFARAARAGVTPAATVEEGREQLSKAVGTSLRTLTASAAEGGRQSIVGVVKQGLSSLAEIAGGLGMQAAELLGLKEAVGWLVGLARKFLARVYDAILALLGQAGLDAVVKKFVGWVDHVTGDGFEGVVAKHLYGLDSIAAGLEARIQAASDPQKLADAGAAVGRLPAAFDAHVSLSNRFLGWLDNYAKFLTTPLPKLKLAVAVIYTLLGGYILLVGADYADADGWYVLDRTDGVRKTVDRLLT